MIGMKTALEARLMIAELEKLKIKLVRKLEEKEQITEYLRDNN